MNTTTTPPPPAEEAAEEADNADVVVVVRHRSPVPDGTRIVLSSMPDDFHHHFRDGAASADVLRHASLRFGRAIAMPNLRVSVGERERVLGWHARYYTTRAG